MKAFALRVAAGAVRALAALVGLFAGQRRDGIVLISCQGDEPSRDILDLAEALGSVRVVAGKMRRSFGGAFLFIGKLFSMLRSIAGAKVVVVDAYCPAVSIPKKPPGRTVVQLWHAPEAIKKFSWQIVDTPAGYSAKTAEILCMHRGYDYILCPAGATRPFFAEAFGYPEDVFVKLGLPVIDRVGVMKRPAAGEEESAERVMARSSIYEKYPDLRERALTVVYAPTFRDGVAVDAAGIVRAFERMADVTLVLKLHPLDTEKIGTFGSAIVDTEFPLIEWYSAADVIITDYSGVAVEAAAAGLASYYYIYDIDDYKARRGLNVDMREEAIGKYAFTDADALAAQVINDFTGAEACSYDFEALAAFAGKYLEVPLSGNTDRLAAYITEISQLIMIRP